VVYLIDVSGHGIEPALLSVSVHNMLRSGSLGGESMATPEAVLAALNKLFQMDEQDGHFLTVWYGVYQASTATLRYASAGAPPALAFHPAEDGSVSVDELPTTSAPVGMFADTVFTSSSYVVRPGSRILLCSDGAYEIAIDTQSFCLFEDFAELAGRLAASANWSLDGLVKELIALTSTGAFEDDCSLIQLTFD